MGILIGKLKWAGIALLALALATAGALAFAPGGGAKRHSSPRMSRPALVQAEAARDRVGKIFLGFDEGLSAFDPKTGESSRVLIQCHMRPRISPDGRLIAFEWEGAVWVRELEKAEPARKLLDLDGAQFGHPVWSPDGSKLIVSQGNAKVEKHEPWRFKTIRINVDGTGREELKIPDEDCVQDWTPGDRLVTESSRNAQIGWQIYVMKPDGSDQKQLTEGGNPWPTRSSPDGKRILYADGTTDERRGIWVVGIDGKDRRKVLSVAGAQLWSACWSPDGKRIAVVIVDKPKGGEPPKSRLVLQEVDGEGKVEFPLEDVKQADMPDWR